VDCGVRHGEMCVTECRAVYLPNVWYNCVSSTLDPTRFLSFNTV